MANHQLRLGEHGAHRLADREVARVHVVGRGLHQHLAHLGPGELQQGLPAADVDHREQLAVQRLAQLALDVELGAAGHDQQPFVRAEPLQRGVAIGHQGQRHRQFQADGLVDATGERRVPGVATDHQMTAQLLLAQGHAGALAALAGQLVQAGVMQRGLPGDVGGTLLEQVDVRHSGDPLSGHRTRSCRFRLRSRCHRPAGRTPAHPCA